MRFDSTRLETSHMSSNLGLIAHAGPIDDVKKYFRFDEVLDARDAMALAQFLKRVTFSTCERHSTSPDEAQRMMDALNSVRRIVNEAGFDPR
jgi:hypothetical protein